MSFNANRHSANDLAAQLSATEDGLFTNASFEAAFNGAGSIGGFEVSRTSGASGPAFNALANFDLGMTEYDAVESSCDIGTALLSDNVVQEAVDTNAGVAWPTPYSAPSYFVGDGSQTLRSEDLSNDNALASMEFCADQMRAGWSGHDKPSMASLEGLSALAQTAPANPRVRDYRRVVAAALLAGTPTAGKTAQALILKAGKLAELADKRAQVVADARRGFQEALSQANIHDQRALQTARRMLDAKGNFRAGTIASDVERLKLMRERAFALGRRAIRYQKVNVLGTALTRNAIAQADLLHKTAAAVLSGNVGATAALGAMYDEIGQQSLQIRALRKQQVQSWQKDGLSGLGTMDPYEAELNSSELAWGGWLKKAARSVKKFAKPIVKTVKEGAKIATAPLKATVQAGVQVGHGNFKGAFKSIGKSVVDSAKSVKNIAATTLLDMPCMLASSKVGRSAVQYAGQAVGTFYGGPVGGAVGSEAGRQAGESNKSMCGAIKTIGLTDGNFRPGKVKGAFKRVGKDLWKNSLSPKAALKSAMNIGMNYLSSGVGSAGGGAMSSFGTETVGKLGLSKLASGVEGKVAQRIQAELTQRGEDYLKKQAMKAGTKYLSRAVGGRAAGLIAQGAQAYAGGKVDTQALFQAAKQEGVKLARQEAQKQIRRQVERQIGPAATQTGEKWLQTRSIFG